MHNDAVARGCGAGICRVRRLLGWVGRVVVRGGWSVPVACVVSSALAKLTVSFWAGGAGLRSEHSLSSLCAAAWRGVDTGLYLSIAGTGYPAMCPPDASAGIPTEYAFFPGFPMAVRLVWLPGASYGAAIIVSVGSVLAASVLLLRLVALDYGPKAARWCVVCLFAFPAAFLLLDAMSDGPFLLLTVGCAYQSRRRRWGGAACMGGVAALTRPFGVLTAVIIVCERFDAGCRSRGAHAKTALLAAAPAAGLALYGAFNWVRTGDFLAFVRVQAQFQRHLSDPVSPLADAVRGTVHAGVAGSLTILSLTLLLLAGRRLRRSYWAFALACIAAPLMTGSVLSMSRFLAVVWPVPLALALETEEQGWGDRALVGFMILVQLALLWMRARGYGPVV